MLSIMSTPRSLLTLLGLLSLLLLTGCPSGPAVPPVVPVKGRVSVDDKPLTAGQVSFFPETPDEKFKIGPPSGQIDASGNYELFTEGHAGAPAGKYKVMVTPAMVPTPGAKEMPKAPFNAKYRDPKSSDLVIEVVATPGPNAYDLKLKH
jgi:hypothetical protein